MRKKEIAELQKIMSELKDLKRAYKNSDNSSIIINAIISYEKLC